MGIKNLNTLLGSKKFTGLQKKYPLSTWRGHKIAIEANGLIYKYFIKSYENVVKRTDLSVGEPNKDEVIDIDLPGGTQMNEKEN